MTNSKAISTITIIGPLEKVNPENDNVDVHVLLADGSTYSFVFATPNNIFWCMANEGVDYFFGIPPVLVRLLNRECIEAAIHAMVTEDEGRWIQVYGTLQSNEID